MTKDAKLNLRIDVDTHTALKALAAADRRNLADYVRIALIDHVRAAKPQRSKELTR